MPIILEQPVKCLDQDQFGAIAYELMGHAFELHQEMGRFFDEHVYRNELARRFGERGRTEFMIHVDHENFRKCYRVDLLVDNGAVFEIKTVRKLSECHRSQLIQYLMLLELRHGKLLNFRSEQMEHEFVNCAIATAIRKALDVEFENWRRGITLSNAFSDSVLNMLSDWGTGLEASLYAEAIEHKFGGEALVGRDIEVFREGHRIGTHHVHLLNPVTAFKITAIQHNSKSYELHLKRLLRHTSLETVLWANVTVGKVSFREVSR